MEFPRREEKEPSPEKEESSPRKSPSPKKSPSPGPKSSPEKTRITLACKHGSTRGCSKCKTRVRCIHGKEKTYCKDCGGGSICVHGIRRSFCKQCGGSQICQCGKRKSLCKTCSKRKKIPKGGAQEYEVVSTGYVSEPSPLNPVSPLASPPENYTSISTPMFSSGFNFALNQQTPIYPNVMQGGQPYYLMSLGTHSQPMQSQPMQYPSQMQSIQPMQIVQSSQPMQAMYVPGGPFIQTPTLMSQPLQAMYVPGTPFIQSPTASSPILQTRYLDSWAPQIHPPTMQNSQIRSSTTQNSQTRPPTTQN
jgi:hypothetical protein